MNCLTIFLIVVVSLSSMISFSFAQNSADPNRDVYIFVQTFVRNSDGQLVHYFENDKFTHKYFKELNEFLDSEAARLNDPIYDVNGQKFQLIKRSKVTQNESSQLVSSTQLRSEESSREFLVRYAHDGYFLAPGDEITQVWIFLRIIN